MAVYWYSRPQAVLETDRPYAYPNALFRNLPNSGILARVKAIIVLHPTYSLVLRDSASLGDPGGEYVQGTLIGVPQGLNLDRSSYYPPDDPKRFSQCELYCSQIVNGISGGQLMTSDRPDMNPPAGEIVLPPSRAFVVRGLAMGQPMTVSVIWTEEPYEEPTG